jgi:hypothetical protein
MPLRLIRGRQGRPEAVGWRASAGSTGCLRRIILNHFWDSQKIGRAGLHGFSASPAAPPGRVTGCRGARLTHGGTTTGLESVRTASAHRGPGALRVGQGGAVLMLVDNADKRNSPRQSKAWRAMVAVKREGMDYAAQASSISPKALTMVIGTHASIRAVFSSRS